MTKHITKVVLTGGPAAGKTTLVSRVLKEFKQEDGWRVITIPETATELISGFGIKPFGGCMSMLAFQDFVVADQIHKEKLALDAAQLVPEENILILYDRALMDDKAYVTDEEFAQVIARFDGRTEERVLANYDLVLHLITRRIRIFPRRGRHDRGRHEARAGLLARICAASRAAGL